MLNLGRLDTFKHFYQRSKEFVAFKTGIKISNKTNKKHAGIRQSDTTILCVHPHIKKPATLLGILFKNQPKVSVFK